ncbi:flagellar hook-length control protein FliK [Nitrosospira sp. NpAV]|uniref:flagellar hook-length control protein FliK n=1 Tax=Nitrosospira sp. NpAV TaxID=58133 RepID=UPI0009FB9EC1|nr:flagellar hook-length control protein FliK [Nitrosospira sp. NpAV]
MLTLPMLQNSPNNTPSPAVKNTVNTAVADEEDMQTASFGKVLAQEMSGKGETRSVDGNTKAGNIPEDTKTAGDSRNMADAKDSKVLEDSNDAKDLADLSGLEGSGDLKDLKKDSVVNSPEPQETREMKLDAVTGSPQWAGLAGILHGLIAAYRPEIRTDASTGSDAGDDVLAANTLIDTEKDRATTIEHQAGLLVMQPGLAAAQLDKDGRMRSPSAAASAVADTTDPVSEIAGIPAAVPAPSAGAKNTSEIHDIRNGMAIPRESDTRRADPQQMEFKASASDPSINTAGLGKSLLELASGAPRDLPAVDSSVTGLLNMPAPLGAAPVEHTVAAASGGVPIHASLGLETRVGASGWDNALGQKILWMVSNQQQVAELNLNPPDLGPLQVVLSLSDDQASATFVSQHADVRQALEAALPRLREMMADSGISLAETTVSADASQRQGGFEQQDRSGARHVGNRETAGASTVRTADIGMSRIPAGGNRLVDTFA